MSDEKYCYPDSNVLKNKYDIRDLEELHKKECFTSAGRIVEMRLKPVSGNFDLKHLQAIHRRMFSDMYDWAGEIRTIDIAKSNLFCLSQNIYSFAEDVFGFIRGNKYFIGDDLETAIRGLARSACYINDLHPFREGNGRSQRQFIQDLGIACGIFLDYRKTNAEETMDAAKQSFGSNFTPFAKIFRRVSSAVPAEDQEDFLNAVSPRAYSAYKDLQQKDKLPEREKEFVNLSE